MIHKSLRNVLVLALACSPVLAQNSEDKPLSEADLLKQIETLNPIKPAARAAATPEAAARPVATPEPAVTPEPTVLRATAVNSVNSLFADPNATGTAVKPATPTPSGDKKAKGPTEITALEATFDQRANIAVFIGSVVVKDPEFNVVCDKLTAYLKHDKGAPTASGPPGKTTPHVATPKPVTPKPATPNPDGTMPPPKKQGGLDKALAVTTSERRVIITQDKVEADGSITHGIGISDFAFYDANTGDITLWGMPDVTQGVDRCIATDPSTVMTLNRDGRMTAKGPHRTIITDAGDSRGPSSSSK